MTKKQELKKTKKEKQNGKIEDTKEIEKKQ